MRIDKPLSKEQLKQGDIIPPGNYQFEVLEANEKISAAGNDMIELKLKVWLEDGRERILFDYLLEAMEWKTGHFAECVGLYDAYQSGFLPADECIGKSGELKTYIQKDKKGQYPDKAAVADYLLTTAQEADKFKRKQAEISNQAKPEFDDDVPF